MENQVSRIRWIKIESKRVLLADFSHAKVAESLALVDSFTAMVRDEPEQSVLLLSNVTGADYDPSIARQWKAARLAQDAKIRASAIFGLAGLVGTAIRGFVEARRLMGMADQNSPRIFGDEASARAWLAGQ